MKLFNNIRSFYGWNDLQKFSMQEESSKLFLFDLLVNVSRFKNDKNPLKRLEEDNVCGVK